MKSVFFTTCFVFLTVGLFAQTVADAGKMPAAMPLMAKATKTSATTVASHNEMAYTQIGNYLKENLEYPVEMTEFGLDGNVTAAIILSESGEIAKVIIAKTDLPKAFGKQLTETLLGFKKVKVKRSAYYGNNVLYVPVHFSL